jgi:hypothetical protein
MVVYTIATYLGPLRAVCFAEAHGLFVHHPFLGREFLRDFYTVSAINCGLNATSGMGFLDLADACGYMEAIAPLADWVSITGETPISDELRAAVCARRYNAVPIAVDEEETDDKFEPDLASEDADPTDER